MPAAGKLGLIEGRAPPAVAGAGAGFALLFLVQMTILVVVWVDSRVDAARVREAIAWRRQQGPGRDQRAEGQSALLTGDMRRSRQVSRLASTFLHLAPEDLAKAPYLEDWARQYDYVLILNAGGVPDLHRVNPDQLDLITANDTAALFRVEETPEKMARRGRSRSWSHDER